MGSLARLCCLAACLGATVARPSVEVSQRDARGQTIQDGTDPLEKSRSMSLTEAYRGGVVPVALMYDDPEDLEVKRPLREILDTKKGDSSIDSLEASEEETIPEKSLEEENTKSTSKNSKILSLEARETDDDVMFGIQSRNKATSDEDHEELLKPFVYNVQPLSFYTPENKDEQNILNYINKIKEIRESQAKQDEEDRVKQDEESKKQNKVTVDKSEDAVVTDSEVEEEGPIRRKIQHYETIIKPMMMDTQSFGPVPHGMYPVYPASTLGVQPYPAYQPYPVNAQPYQQAFNPYVQAPQAPTVVYLPNPFKADTSQSNTKTENTRIFDDYFPFVVNNPFNEIWAGITNIIEYGPAADVCRRNKKESVNDDDETTETVLDLPSMRRISLGGGSKTDSWPKIARLKVRRGGVAIAGPGGIATAGSGGTAIVGPGGTAYTTREGTAVVGPGGKVVHVPQFPVYAKNVDGSEPREFLPPPGSRTVAEGPIVYYDNPLEHDDLPDPTIPV